MVGQGWTLSVAADDKGAFANCDGKAAVQFPGSSPDVVAAGGTTLSLDGFSNFVTEQAWVGASDTTSCQDNFGGGGGGCSQKFTFTARWQFPVNRCPNVERDVPDISLNADFGLSPENIFLNGSLQGNGGTSIVAPELAGFFAQENSYLMTIGKGPLGNPDAGIYRAITGNVFTAAPHDPFYDVVGGCTNGGTGNCAVTGYDLATGLGSANMLQLAWALNWFSFNEDGAPVVSFSGPATGAWYNTDQTVSWSVSDTDGGSPPASGVAGYSDGWDFDPGDPTSHSTPGCCDSFYDGPQVPNGLSGSLDLANAGEGCHTVNVRAWDNMGLGSGDQTYGPLCYDVTAPQTTATLNGTAQGGSNYLAPVQVTLTASDNLSGVSTTTYQVDGGSVQTYSAPFNVTALGAHTVTFHSTDVAGNVENTQSVSFTIVSAATATPTKTPVPPTATKTPVPPTATKTSTPKPTATKTPVPPTATPTKTPVGPTATPTRTPTKTPVPATSTPTRTPVAATATPTKTPMASASISLSRSSGHYKDPVTVTGSGFGPSETVNVYLDTTASTPLTSTSSTAGGALSAVFTGPQAISGTHTILAVGQSSGRSGSAPFKELPGAFLLHYQGNKGSTDVLKGAGFAAHETVVGYWNTPSGTPFAVTATTNSIGTFGGSSTYPGITFTVPLSPTGQYPVYAVGQSSGGVAHATFTLNPHLSVSPTSAHAGASVTVSGTGYGAHETVSIKYNCGTSGCSSTTILATPTTDGNGFFSIAVALPGTTSLGVHAIGGTGGTTGVFATTTITIN